MSRTGDSDARVTFSRLEMIAGLSFKPEFGEHITCAHCGGTWAATGIQSLAPTCILVSVIPHHRILEANGEIKHFYEICETQQLMMVLCSAE